MYEAVVEIIKPNRVMRYTLTREGAAMTYIDVLDLWESDAVFRDFYWQTLAESPFSAYRWETPCITRSTARQSYQFVLLNSQRFVARKPDRKTFSSFYTSDDIDCGVVSFMNLSGDARLIVPSPTSDNCDYGHLAAFVRCAPKPQLDAFWCVVGSTVKSEIGDKPLWLNTAGGGVAWLHVRLDSQPKYYGHAPYKQA